MVTKTNCKTFERFVFNITDSLRIIFLNGYVHYRGLITTAELKNIEYNICNLKKKMTSIFTVIQRK